MKTALRKTSRHAATAAVLCSLAVALGTPAGHAGPFALLVTQSPPGPDNQNPANWQGVLQYSLAGSGGVMTAEAGLAKSAVADPAGLAFRAASGEVFVGNRHGNVSPSSISRFFYNPATRALTSNSAITGNGLFGVHQIAFNPVTGEMFAANVNNGVSRFTFDAYGTAAANGIISNGAARGVAVSPDGTRLYVTGAGSSIRQFDLATGSELASVTVPSGNGGLHYFGFNAGRLYVAALYDDLVYRYALDASNNLTLKDSLAMNDPVGMAFSPDGQEMFVTGHRSSDLIYRLRYDAPTDTWKEVEIFDSGSSLGDVLAMPNAPQLAVTLTVNNAVAVFWPSPSTGWNLQQNTNDGSLLNWSNVTSGIADDGTTRTYLVNPPSGARFYRLYKP